MRLRRTRADATLRNVAHFPIPWHSPPVVLLLLAFESQLRLTRLVRSHRAACACSTGTFALCQRLCRMPQLVHALHRGPKGAHQAGCRVERAALTRLLNQSLERILNLY